MIARRCKYAGKNEYHVVCFVLNLHYLIDRKASRRGRTAALSIVRKASYLYTVDELSLASQDPMTDTREPQNRRSRLITQGVQRSPNRAMLRAVGFGDADFDKPIVGIANGYSTITPCNAGLDVLADRAEKAVRLAGGMPQVFGTVTVSDGISMGTEGMKYSLVSREVIADAIETACGAESMDGVVCVGGCDKNMPGAMIAMARMNIPGIFVYGGTIKPGHLHGQDLTIVSPFEAVG